MNTDLYKNTCYKRSPIYYHKLRQSVSPWGRSMICLHLVTYSSIQSLQSKLHSSKDSKTQVTFQTIYRKHKNSKRMCTQQLGYKLRQVRSTRQCYVAGRMTFEMKKRLLTLSLSKLWQDVEVMLETLKLLIYGDTYYATYSVYRNVLIHRHPAYFKLLPVYFSCTRRR